MSGIVCAIRGGPASKSTLRKAIELAQEGQRPLYLLYVIDLNFLRRTTQSRTAGIQEEMRDMGEMILLLAQDTAVAANVATHSVIREGEVESQIAALCNEVDADQVVVGHPISERDTAAFTPERLQQFGARLQEKCRAELVVVE